MRHIDQRGIDLIRQFESFVPYFYICPAGYPTIGYGHVILANDNYGRITGAELLAIYARSGLKAAQNAYIMTLREAEALSLKDIQSFERSVLRYINVPLTDGQFDALVSFTFNFGGGALQRSTLRRKVNREEHADVPAEFRKWIWSNGKKLKGLIERRNFEATMYLQS